MFHIMSDKTLVLIIILVFELILKQNIDCVFVSVGDYPNYREYGINLPECGLRFINGTEFYNISYSVKCFGKSYNKKLYFISGRNPIDNNVRQRIAFGVDAKNGEAPFTVYLELVREIITENRCTGILVSLKWVLTAAHCLKRGYDFVSIYAGSNLKDGERRRVGPKFWFIHPNYEYRYFNGSHNIIDYRSENDIALIKLFDPYSTNVRNKQYLINTICLPNTSDLPNTKNDLAKYFGFGQIRDNTRAESLQKGVAYLLPFGNCPEGRSMFCTDTVGNVTKLCKGDSGGPLLQYLNDGLKAVLVGVAQGVFPEWATCQSSTRSFWVSVNLHLDWILKTIEKHN